MTLTINGKTYEAGELVAYVEKLEKENAELKQDKEGKVVEHFEAYGQCRDSRRIAELEEKLKHAEENCINKTCVVFKDKEDCVAKLLELEKENAELKAQLESERDLPAIAYMQGAEKQKKKDEEELKKWKDEWQEQVQKATDEGYARTLQTMQLTKAKEIIREFVEWATWQGSNCPNFKNIQDKAEAFLNSKVEK